MRGASRWWSLRAAYSVLWNKVYQKTLICMKGDWASKLCAQLVFYGRQDDVVEQQTWFALRFLWIVGQRR